MASFSRSWLLSMSYGLYLWHAPVGWLTDARHYDWVPIMSRPVQFIVRVKELLEKPENLWFVA